MKAIEEQRLNITHNQPVNGRRRNKASQLIDRDSLDEVDIKLVAVNDEVSSLEDTLEMKKKALKDETKNVEYWMEIFPHRTRDELIDYRKSIGNPEFEY